MAAPYYAVELIFQNSGTTPMTIPGACVAPSSSFSDIVTPRAANGSAVTCTPVTVGGVATNFVLPPAVSLMRRQITVSDPIPLTSLPRTDGGNYPLLFARVLAPASGSYDVPTDLATILPGYSSITNGQNYAGWFTAADGVSTPTNQAAVTSANVQSNQWFELIAGVRFLSATRVVTLMSCGDSLTAGYQTATGADGFGLQASVDLTKQEGVPVLYVAHGFPGMVTANFGADCKQAIDALQPGVVTIPIESPNDLTNTLSPGTPLATATEQAAEATEMNLIDYAGTHGALPVVVSPIPFSNTDLSAQYGSVREAAGDLSRTLPGEGVPLLDAQTVISGYQPTATHLQTLPSTCLAGDNAHLNDMCQAKLGQALANLLAPRF